jgi:hydrogenase maturation factor
VNTWQAEGKNCLKIKIIFLRKYSIILIQYIMNRIKKIQDLRLQHSTAFIDICTIKQAVHIALSDDVSMNIGQSFKIKTGTLVGKRKFSSTNKKVVSVSKKGKVVAKKSGKAKEKDQ